LARQPRELTAEEAEALLSMRREDFTLEWLRANLASINGKDPPRNPCDTLTMPAGRLGAKGGERTTVGRVIFNAVAIEPVRDVTGFVNEPITQKRIDGIGGQVCEAVVEETLPPSAFADFIQAASWLGFATSGFTIPALDRRTLVCPPKTAALRRRLFKERAEELARGDVAATAEVEAAIVASAREELAGTTIMDYYDSGARADFGNHFKNMVLMRGLVADPENPGKFVVATGNLAEGTPKAEMVQGANLLLAAAGGRALQTRISGL
jgi:hypothetical protein